MLSLGLLLFFEKPPTERMLRPLLDETMKTPYIAEMIFDQLSEALPKEFCKLYLSTEKTLANSRIIIKFENQTNDDLSKRFVHQTVKKSLKSLGIPIASDARISISIPLDFKFDSSLINQLKTTIESQLHEQRQLVKLESQIQSLESNRLLDAIHSIFIDQNKKYFKQFYLRISQEIAEIVNEARLKLVFKDCHVTADTEYMTITGSKPGDESLLQALIHDINKRITALAYDAQSKIILHDDARKKDKKTRLQTQSDSSSSTSQTIQKLATTKKSIKWTSGTYHPEQKNCTVYELESGTRLPQRKFFIMSQLTVENFSDVEAYEKVNAAIENSHFASARMGSQGIVFTPPKKMYDSNGNSFTSTAKLKLLGKFGDLRAYAEVEKSQDNEVLCVFKSYEQRAH
jgi:hypothetical protein